MRRTTPYQSVGLWERRPIEPENLRIPREQRPHVIDRKVFTYWTVRGEKAGMWHWESA